MQTKPERTSHDFTHTSGSADSQFQWDPSGYAFRTLCGDSGIHFALFFFFKFSSTLFSSCLCGNLSWDKWFLLQTFEAVLNIQCCCSAAKSSLTLRPHGLQHTRLLCPSLSPGVCSNLYLLSQWCYLTTSSSGSLFSFCPPFFPASGSFPMSWLFTTGGQSIGAFSKIIHFIYFFWLCCVVCGILIPQPGVEPKSPALEGCSFYHRSTREVQDHAF